MCHTFPPKKQRIVSLKNKTFYIVQLVLHKYYNTIVNKRQDFLQNTMSYIDSGRRLYPWRCAKMFTIAGPVIVYGTAVSVVYGIIYWITTLF